MTVADEQSHADRPLRLGFACSWWHPREATWSYTPMGLLTAIRQQEGVVVTTIDAQRTLLGKGALAAGHAVLSRNAWQYGRLNRRMTTRRVVRASRSLDLDAVLAVGETEPRLTIPTFLYQDMGFGVVLENRDRLGSDVPNLPTSTRRRMRQLASEQSRLYRTSAGVFTMGRWFARWLIEEEGLPEARVHAIGGGLNAFPSTRRASADGGACLRLLFIGRDFSRKGGDLVVDAVARLRAEGLGAFRLTVVGPSSWPRKGQPPSWVDFRGPLSRSAISQLWASHDVFVLPSWFEAYGTVFLEARAAGLPCVARRAFAMPELVPDGSAGKLVDEDGGVAEVAEAIHAVSVDRSLFERVHDDADDVLRDNSWGAVASRALGVIGGVRRG